MFIAVINEVSDWKGSQSDVLENFAVAEEQKRKQQIEAFIRKTEPISIHKSWIDRFNPYRLMAPHHASVKVNSLPPNLVLPIKQITTLDNSTGLSDVSY